MQGRRGTGTVLSLRGENGVRYTVPQSLHPDPMPEELTVRFRVAEPPRNKVLAAYADGVRIARRRRPVLTPGEMEQLTLKKADLQDCLGDIVIRIEEG